MHHPLALSMWHIGHGVSQVRGQSAAGPGSERRRSWDRVSQVCVFGVTCDAKRPQGQKSVAGPALFADLRRNESGLATEQTTTCDGPGNVAGPGTECRRSAFFASPATQMGHRDKKESQVRQFLQTCDKKAWDPRRKRARPATLKT